jgi:membrane-bound serine protease (ClpP class)
MAGNLYFRDALRRLFRRMFALGIFACAAGGTFVWSQESKEQPAKAAKAERDAAPAAELGDGRLVRIRLPLVGNADEHFKSVIQRAVSQLGLLPRRQGRRPVLVLELVPALRHSGYGQGTDFERALSLARYLTSPEVAGVKTVAYIPQTIKGHGVLVALACEEIVMDPAAELGEAGIDEKSHQAIEPGIVSSYRQIRGARQTVPEAIALGMLEPEEVLKVETDDSTEFVRRSDLERLKQTHTIVSEETIVPPGSMGSFSGRQGREYGFVKLLASDREALARGLALPLSAVAEDQSLAEDWRPVMLSVEGPITPRKVRQLETLIGNQIHQHKVNWIGLKIDSEGGKLEDCLQLANSIAELDANEVQTVAYVPVDASNGAALVALACDLQRRRGSRAARRSGLGKGCRRERSRRTAAADGTKGSGSGSRFARGGRVR